MIKLLSYHGKKKIKSDLIKRMETHIELDELVQGATGQNGRGCTVWCALNNGKLKRGYDHKAFEDVLGLPQWLAKLQDRIFESLPKKKSEEFSIAWIKAIPVGRNLEKVKYQFLKWVLKDGENNTYQHCSEKGKAATDGVYALLLRAEIGDMPTIDEWRQVQIAAAYAATAAAYAAYAAYAAAAAAAAATAAYATATAAADAYAYAAADAYAYAAREKYWICASKELLRLLENA